MTESESASSHAVRTVKPHRSGTVLGMGILSIISLCLGLVFGLSAYLMGTSDLADMDEGRMVCSGRTPTKVGRTFGIIGIVLGLLWIVAIIVAIVRKLG